MALFQLKRRGEGVRNEYLKRGLSILSTLTLSLGLALSWPYVVKANSKQPDKTKPVEVVIPADMRISNVFNSAKVFNQDIYNQLQKLSSQKPEQKCLNAYNQATQIGIVYECQNLIRNLQTISSQVAKLMEDYYTQNNQTKISQGNKLLLDLSNLIGAWGGYLLKSPKL